MSDFSDRPLVAGSVVGIRSWLVMPDGWLTGVFHPARWLPGVNQASCLSSPLRQFGFSSSVARESGHRVAGVRCTCGFYAYTDMRGLAPLWFGGASRVIGAVEGFGTATVGSRGFRCEKARILGLVSNEKHMPVRSPEPVLSAATVAWLIERVMALLGLIDTVDVPERSSVVPESVRDRYPDVPIFDSTAALLDRFPLTSVASEPRAVAG